jgi:hypothetical protein
VFPYQAGDLKGMSPVVIVTGAGSDRANQLTSTESGIKLEVHTFVLYALRPVLSSGTVAAGNHAIIYLSDTSMFSLLQDDNNYEIGTIEAIDPDVAITIGTLASSYVDPKVSVWTERQSEDMLDLIESSISDEVRLANDADIWSSIENDGESVVDVVDFGGEAYRHETIPVRVMVVDF